MDELENIVVDKQTFNIKKKALDRLENIELKDEVVELDEDKKITLHKASIRQIFRKQTSDKIEEFLYNNRDLVYINTIYKINKDLLL